MLTEKEKVVLELRSRGMKQTQIASKLKISQSAVSAFESNGLKKLREAEQAIKFAKDSKIRLDG